MWTVLDIAVAIWIVIDFWWLVVSRRSSKPPTDGERYLGYTPEQIAEIKRRDKVREDREARRLRCERIIRRKLWGDDTLGATLEIRQMPMPTDEEVRKAEAILSLLRLEDEEKTLAGFERKYRVEGGDPEAIKQAQRDADYKKYLEGIINDATGTDQGSAQRCDTGNTTRAQ